MSAPTVRAGIGATPYAVALADGAGHAWLADEPLDAGGAALASALEAANLKLTGLVVEPRNG